LAPSSIYLFDANAIIEAVRTGVWRAMVGGLIIETVDECAQECRRGDTLAGAYVSVSDGDLGRLSAVHTVDPSEVSAIVLYEGAAALDLGERDLFAYALSGRIEGLWAICSPDHASVRFAVARGCGNQLVSLQAAVDEVGARPNPSLRHHFTTAWLSTERTKAMLGVR